MRANITAAKTAIRIPLVLMRGRKQIGGISSVQCLRRRSASNAMNAMQPTVNMLTTASTRSHSSESSEIMTVQQPSATNAYSILFPAEAEELLASHGETPLKGPISAAELLRRPSLTLEEIGALTDMAEYDDDILSQIETRIKYEGYIEKQQRQIEQFRKLENRRLLPDTDYSAISGLRLEARAKLSAAKPENIGQAARISGVSPSDIAVLLVYDKQRRGK